METNQRIAEWLGYKLVSMDDLLGHVIDNRLEGKGDKFCSTYPDFQNSDSNAITLLPELVKRGYEPALSCDESQWLCRLWSVSEGKWVVFGEMYKDTISAAITTAVMRLIESI